MPSNQVRLVIKVLINVKDSHSNIFYHWADVPTQISSAYLSLIPKLCIDADLLKSLSKALPFCHQQISASIDALVHKAFEFPHALIKSKTLHKVASFDIEVN